MGNVSLKSMPFQRCVLFFLIVWFSVLSSQCIAEEKYEPGLVTEIFSFNQPVIDFPTISPGTAPTYRRVDENIAIDRERNIFPGTDLAKEFYVRWRGEIRIPAGGKYTFFLRSDDGSRLFIDGQKVIDHGGLHPWLENSGATTLTTGNHNIEVEYFQNHIGMGCILSWEAEGIAKEVVPAGVLFHRETARNPSDRYSWLGSPEGDYQPRRWQSTDGLPHNSVSSILQTRDGYLWVGTPKGLARFDGVHFDIINPEVKGQAIRSLFEANDGAVWIVSEKGDLFRYQDSSFSANSLTTNGAAKSVFQTRDGVLWIGTTNGVISSKDGKTAVASQGLNGRMILAGCEDHEGNLFLGSDRGLILYRDKSGKIQNQLSELPGKSPIRALLCEDDSLWIGTGGSGLFRLKNGKLDEFHKAAGLPDDFIDTLFKDSRGEFWVGTMSGLCRRLGEKFIPELNSDGLSYETVFCLTEDNEGCLWLGTKEGLNQLQTKPFKAYTKQQGLYHNNVTSVCTDSRDTVWITTWGGGLSGLKNGEIVSYDGGNSPLYDLLLSVCEARDGNLWIGAEYNGGLFRFKDGTFTRFGKKEGLIDPAIRTIFEDRHGNLWIGTSGALYQMQGGALRRFTKEDGLAGNVIRAIREDETGDLWIGSNDGLTRRHNEKFSVLTTKDGLSANAVLAIYEDRERNLWIGTDGGGLNRLSNGRFKSYTSKDGLLSDSVFEVLEDDRGNLWMSCFSGIFRVRKKDFDEIDSGTMQQLRCASYGKADGMSSVQCNGVSKPAGWKGRDGRLWFPTTRGVVVVDPNSVKNNDSPPPVVIESIVADRKKFDVSEHLTIAPGKGVLEIHYTALSFRAPEKNRFKYKLEGVDSEWVDAGTRRIAYYNNIKPRTYTFRVIGCNNDGVWNETGASVSFVLLPHFWQTTWFISLISLAAVGLVAGTARFITWRKVQDKIFRLEHQHAIERERSRIARDMHDELGARLTEIAVLSTLTAKNKFQPEAVQTQSNRISNATAELIEDLHTIIWSVNPANDTLEKLLDHIREHATSFLETSSIRCRIVEPKGLPSRPVSAEVRHHLFLTVKEALNNIVKHADAGEVKITITLVESVLTVEVEDNGKGFVVSQSNPRGNGLLNMEERMKKLGGAFMLTSAPGKGTCLQLKVPLRTI